MRFYTSQSGHATKLEERGVFQGQNPDNNMRPDITILNPFVHSQEHLIDVSICCPVEGSQKGILKVHEKSLSQVEERVDKALENRFKAKEAKYAHLCKEMKIAFTPFIVASSGTFHDEAKAFLLTLCANLSKKENFPQAGFYSYFLKRLSCTLQRGIAKCILKRVEALNTPKLQEQNTRSMSLEAIMNSNHVNL